MYAIVRAGGRQEKVAVGDVLVIDKVQGKAGDSVELVPILLVDGETVTSDAKALGARLYLTPPHSQEQLKKAVQHVTRLR